MGTKVEVYEVEKDKGILTEPIHVIQTDCRGLSAFVTSDQLIYMGFVMSMAEMKATVQAYDYEYQRQAHIVVPLEGNIFSDLRLCMNGEFLLGSHNEGIFSIIRLSDQDVQLVEQPFGYVDVIENIEPYSLCIEGEP